MIKVGIVGYGNLGKALEKVILSKPDLKLVAIFSRRNVVSKFGTIVEPYSEFFCYKNKIDVMLLAGGSKTDLETQTPQIATFFDCINTFDTHSKIDSELKIIDKICKENKTRAILSVGWDPGIFSLVRVMFKAIGRNQPITFWGKGISMGHSEAIRSVQGVVDAVQFTIPNPEAKKQAKSGFVSNETPLSLRECYVFTNEKDTKKIENKIKSIPNYFLGQPTSVNFVSQEKILKLKKRLYHKGEIVETFSLPLGFKSTMKFSVQMQSNPNFTANILVAYLSAISHLKNNGQVGAFTALDIPIKYLFSGKAFDNIYKDLC